MKLCKDCKYYNCWRTRCYHPNSASIDPVTGFNYGSSAGVNRKYDSFCGIEAKWFESKKPLFSWFTKQKIDLSQDSN